MSMHPLIVELNEQKQKFQKRARTVFSEEFKSFFERFPEVREIVWTQYTPYFNDGDPCTFGVSEPCAKMAPDATLEPDVVEDLKERNDNDCDNCVITTIRDNTCSKWRPAMRSRTQRESDLIDAFEQLSSLVQGMDDLMQDMFGDHIIVRASSNGFDVEEYDHD